MKKNRQIYFALLCLAAFVFASCEQKTDVNVQNEENRIFSEEIINVMINLCTPI